MQDAVRKHAHGCWYWDGDLGSDGIEADGSADNAGTGATAAYLVQVVADTYAGMPGDYKVQVRLENVEMQVLMVRVDLVPMELHSFETGQPAEPAPAATISIDLDGTIFLDRQEVALSELAREVEERDRRTEGDAERVRIQAAQLEKRAKDAAVMQAQAGEKDRDAALAKLAEAAQLPCSNRNS